MKKLMTMVAGLAIAGLATAGTVVVNGVTVGSGAIRPIPYSGAPSGWVDTTNHEVSATGISSGMVYSWTDNGLGQLEVITNAGRVKGAFSIDATPSPYDFLNSSDAVSVTSTWILPTADQVMYSGFDGVTGAPNTLLNSRFYTGLRTGPNASSEQMAVLGHEYDATEGTFFVRSDNNAVSGLDGVNAVPFDVGQYSYMQSTATHDGVGLGWTYAFDFGSAVTPPGAFGNPIAQASLTGGGFDPAGDTPATSIRGYATGGAIIQITDASLSSIGFGVDTDGDGTNDESDLWPDDANFELDSDSDGLPDEWETDNFSNLAETAGGNPDGDDLTNVAEFLASTDPNVSNGNWPPIAVGVPVVSVFGLGLLSGAVALAGVRRARKAN